MQMELASTKSTLAALRLCRRRSFQTSLQIDFGVRGRATRVFEVTEKSDPLHNLALKDQWMGDDRQAEG